MERMADEVIEAEIVDIAVPAGFHADAAARDPYLAPPWAEEQLTAYGDELSEDERACCPHGDPREDRPNGRGASADHGTKTPS